MAENISLVIGSTKISEEALALTVNTIFPGENYLQTLIALLCFFLTGFLTFSMFFYFSKRRKMWQSMKRQMKFWFSISMGFISFMAAFIIFFGLILIDKELSKIFSSQFYTAPFIIVGGFILYFSLILASLETKGRDVFMKTYRNLMFLAMLLPITFLLFVIGIISNHLYIPLSFLLIDAIAIYYLLYLPKKNTQTKPY